MNIVYIQPPRIIGRQEGWEVTEKHEEMINAILQDGVFEIVSSDAPNLSYILSTATVIITADLSHVSLETSPYLKWVHVTYAGVDNMSEELKNSNVLITNSSGVHPIPITEHVFMFMLMFARKMMHMHDIEEHERSISKEWMDVMPFELYGSTLGIAGLGRIGVQIARIAKAFGMHVQALVRDPQGKRMYIDQLYAIDTPDEFFKTSTFIVNCLPLTPQTHHYFDYHKFSLMQKNSYFINVGRGKSVVEEDLIQALNEGRIAGAGLDVFEVEPLPKDSPLRIMKQVLWTPHASGWTPKYFDRVMEIFCENLKAFINHEQMPTLVDKQKGY